MAPSWRWCAGVSSPAATNNYVSMTSRHREEYRGKATYVCQEFRRVAHVGSGEGLAACCCCGYGGSQRGVSVEEHASRFVPCSAGSTKVLDRVLTRRYAPGVESAASSSKLLYVEVFRWLAAEKGGFPCSQLAPAAGINQPLLSKLMVT